MPPLHLLVAVALMVVWGPAAHALTTEQIANLTGPDRQRTLEDGARGEGQVLWLGSFNEENAQPIIEGFTARYPFLKVQRVRTDTTKTVQRVLAELRARATRTDLITASSVVQLRAAGAVQNFRSPVLASFRDQDLDPDGFAAPLYYVYNGLAAYNSALVGEAEAPRTFDDLLDPKWRGQMALANSSSSALAFVSFLRMTWGEDKARAWLSRLAAQKPVVRTESARTVLGLVAAGEHKLMINPSLAHVAELTRKGAPLGVLLPNPVPVNQVLLLMAKSAPHPFATMLLIDYLLDVEAQTKLRDGMYFPANPTVEPVPELRRHKPATTGIPTYILDDGRLGEMQADTARLFNELFE